MEYLKIILDSALVVALVSVCFPAHYLYMQHRRKVAASINLIHQYAKIAQKNLGERDRDGTYDSVLENIRKGNPNGEPENDYTPMLFDTEADKLSFEQISEILNHLSDKEQIVLLKYFAAQSTIEVFAREINTDYFRAIPQERKAKTIELFVKIETEELKSATEELVKALDERKREEQENKRWVARIKQFVRTKKAIP